MQNTRLSGNSSLPKNEVLASYHEKTQTILAQTAPLQTEIKKLEAQLKELHDQIGSFNYQGQRAMEKITKDQSIPLAQRVRVFFDAPDGFIMHMEGRPEGQCKAMKSAIDYATEGRDRYSNPVVTLADMADDALNDFEKDENAVLWWDENNGYLAKNFLEEMLQRSLMTWVDY